MFRVPIIDNLTHILRKNNFGVNVEVDNFLNKYGDEIVHKLEVVRAVFTNKIMMEGVKFISPNFKKKSKIEKAYHTFLLVNDNIKIEKVETMTMAIVKSNPKGEIMNVPIHKKITLYELIENAKNKYGIGMLKIYNVKSNNCQHFCINILNANGLLNPAIKDFTKQETEDSISSSLEDTAKKITDGARIARPITKPVMESISNEFFPLSHTYEYFNPTSKNPYPSQNLPST